MLKTLIGILIILFLNQSIKADDFSCKTLTNHARVIAKSGLMLRESLGKDGKILIKVPFWSKVDICWFQQKLDTINNIVGYWRKAKFDHTEGYLFDGYLMETDSNFEKRKEFRIMYEGYPCAVLNFDPELYWYGIYETVDGDSLIKVDISFSKYILNSNMPDNSVQGRIFVYTNKSYNKQSKYLIGSRKELKEKVIKYGKDTNHHSLYPYETSQFIYPEQPYSVYAWNNKGICSKKLQLKALGKVNEDKMWTDFINYRLEISDPDFEFKTQDITDDLSKDMNFERIYLQWFGDIDNDQKPDFIFLSSTFNVRRYMLFISSEEQKGRFVKKVDEWETFNCN